MGINLDKPIWQPGLQELQSSHLANFIRRIENGYGHSFLRYDEFHRWSVSNDATFWKELVEFLALNHSGSLDPIRVSSSTIHRYNWFPNLRLNIGENIISGIREDAPLIEYCANLERREVSKKELVGKAVRLGQILKDLERNELGTIVAVTRNDRNAVIGYISCLLDGKAWCGLPANISSESLKLRLQLIRPQLVLVDNSTSHLIAETLSKEFQIINLDDFFSRPTEVMPLIHFRDYDFGTLISLLFTSGTTGTSKAYFHDCGSYLSQLRDIALHLDIQQSDVVLFNSNPGWVTWNWLISSLGLGSQIVLMNFDWQRHLDEVYNIAKRDRATIFGTSPFFLRHSRRNLSSSIGDFRVRQVVSTGSPLEKDLYYYAQQIFGAVRISSVSGGSEISSCLVNGNPLLPVYAGEIQCASLGLDIDFIDPPQAQEALQKELVCKNALIPMPRASLAGDLEDELIKNYFPDPSKEYWHHGDLGYFTPNGGIVISARRDNTLKPKGIRLNPLDYYDLFLKCNDISDALVTSYIKDNENHVVLVLKSEQPTLLFRQQVERLIEEKLGAFYLPSVILFAGSIPYNLNRKREEIPVKRILQDAVNGRTDTDPNLYSSTNGALLQEIRALFLRELV